MKKTFTILFILIAAMVNQVISQTIYYSENFSTASGTTPPAGWTTSVVSGAGNWNFDNPGSRVLGQSISGAPFAIFDDAASGDNDPEVVELISPAIDLTGKNKSKLLFYEYFEEGFNGKGEVYFRKNATHAWQLIYTVTTKSISNPNKIAVDLGPILALAGSNAQAQVKFSWSGENSFWWIIDDVFVYDNPAKDAAALKADNIPSGCVISLEHPIILTVKNLGSGNLDKVTFNYKINNDSVVSELFTFPSPLASNSNFTYTFDTPGLFKEGANSIKLWPSDPGGTPDEFPANDTIFVNTSLSRLQVANLPFLENFEDSAVSASMCFNLGASGNGRIRIIDSSIVAPCDGKYMLGMDAIINNSTIDALDLLVDLSSCVDKVLSFTYGNINDNQNASDSLFISVDNGATYRSIFKFDMAASNDTCLSVSLNLDSVATANGFSLSPTSIIRWRHAGNNSLESADDGFYLDDIKIDLMGLASVDATVNNIVSPSDSLLFTTGDTLIIKVAFTNLSDTTLATANFSYQYGNGPIITEFWGGCLNLNQTDTFSFSNPLVSDTANKILCVWLENPNDTLDLNDQNNMSCIESTSINEYSTDKFNVKLYPNPAKQQATISFNSNKSEQIQIKIYDLMGKSHYSQVLSKEAGNQKQIIDLSKFSNGIYIYHLIIEDEIINGKFSVIK